MTGRQRLLAALQKKPVDRIPWAPMLVPYTVAGFPESTPHTLPDFGEAMGCDLFMRYGRVAQAIPIPKPFSKIRISVDILSLPAASSQRSGY